MPASTQAHPKKRRRDEDDINDEIHLDFYAHQQQQQQHVTTQPRKINNYSSPLSKKIRINSISEDQLPYQPRHISPTHTRSLLKPTAINLSPCHICHRRPTKKTDLDSYADCEGCGERTCFVCIRQCLGECKGCTPASATHYGGREDLMTDDNDSDDHDDNIEYDEDEENLVPNVMERSCTMEDAPSAKEEWNASQDRTKRGGTWGRGEGRGHRGRICSQCCVELGTQGEVRCLGCLET